MLHDDRDDDKYEGSDEPEYHFSEEEGGDYVDNETPKDTSPSASETEPKATGGVRALAPSKRMMISLVVFLVLVFVVYKMVAPTSPPVPSTDIAAATPAQTAKPQTVEAAKMQQSAPTIAAPVTNAPPTMTAPPVQVMQAPAQPMTAPVAQPAPQQAPASAQTIVSNVTNAVSAMTQGQIMPTGQQPAPTQQPMPSSPPTIIQPVVAQQPPVMQPGTSQPMMAQPMPQQPGTQPPMMQAGPPQQAMTQPTTMPPPVQQAMVQQPSSTQPSGITGMPSVIPVESPTPTIALPASPLNTIANDQQVVALQGESARVMSQLQTDYVQKLNDFSTQNKALQDEVQTLNSRMSAMEGQLNQLVQALTRQQVQGGAVSEPPPVPVEQPVVIDQKTSYNVQAIIPGRAWLRTDNGETLTVAEGDVIKSLGRVTKIDPYDGVVEINTGNKVVSLSYGTAA